MIELKPCPHCRGTWIVVNRPANGSHLSVKCKECNAHGPGHAGITEAEAVAAWNTRPQPTASVDAEPVAWMYKLTPLALQFHPRQYPGLVAAGCTETPLYTEAQVQARADGARREAVDAARSAVFAILRKHDVGEQMFAEIAAATHALKED